MILEREVAGYGASGRNGGWCRSGRDRASRATRRTRLAVYDTVDEVGRVCAAEGIDCDFLKGGSLSVATNEAQLARLHGHLEHASRRRRHRGRRAAARARRAGAADPPRRRAGAVWHAALRAGAAGGARGRPRRRGGADGRHRSTSSTPVREILPGGIARTDQGDVRAPVGRARDRGLHGVDPRPQAHAAADELVDDRDRAADARGVGAIGWDEAETIHDSRTRTSTSSAPPTTASRSAAAACRTASARAPTGTARSRPAPSRASSAALRELFPQAADARVAHGWSGVLGVPRDWQFAVGADPATGVAWSGGYVGVGVAAANLGGRIVADLVRGERSDLVDAPVRRPRLAPRLGAGAAPLPRRHGHVLAVPHRRSPRGPHRAARPAWRASRTRSPAASTERALAGEAVPPQRAVRLRPRASRGPVARSARGFRAASCWGQTPGPAFSGSDPAHGRRTLSRGCALPGRRCAPCTPRRGHSGVRIPGAGGG